MIKNYPEKLHEFHKDLPFLTERMKIEKIEKLAVFLYVKIEFITHIRILKQALTHRLILTKFHRVV